MIASRSAKALILSFYGKGNSMHPGMIGGIIGSICGLAGGIFGTYCGIKSTNGPHERSFVVKASVVTWILCIVFLALLFALPNPYRWFLWLPYVILLPLGIRHMNKKLQSIRQEEAQNKKNAADS